MRRLFDGLVTVLRQFREIVNAKMGAPDSISPTVQRARAPYEKSIEVLANAPATY